MNSYFIFLSTRDPQYCQIDDYPQDLVEKGWRLAKGQRMDQRYPARVEFRMGSISQGIQVSDLIANLLGYCLATAKLKALLDGQTGGDVEYLPFALRNHKDRVEREDCFVVNPVGVHDCVDAARTEGRKGSLEPDQYKEITRLHLDPARIPIGVRLFRIAAMPKILIIRDDLKATLEKAGITGAAYVPLGQPCRIK